MEGGVDLEEKLEWTVIQDKEKLDGADVDAVGDQFLDWLGSEKTKNEQPIYAEEPEKQPATLLGITPRYLCCVHVDAECLDSVLNQAPRPPEPDLWHVGYNSKSGIWVS
ncbi:hypothetical protein PRK78_003274 [Emydomyces testavorans]|uniref:Uncharacterized protein n=1 Tax=Emydomyces testavorans TaxID=2070801 RepID=A0AAF0IIC6_9EURO|nr:hypothetical protein PRK78_003274 [Emydomyces testavorans]